MNLSIRGRAYAVEARTVTHPHSGAEEIRYHLTGARGASFFTLRNVHTPHAMFVVPHSLGNKTLDGVWLSDEDGTLKVVRS